MKRTLAGLVLAAALAAVILAGSGSASSQTWAATKTQAVNLTGATTLGALAGSTPLHLVVGLALGTDNAQPTAAQAQSVADYLTSQGFTGLSVAKNDLMVSATATAAQAQTAFNTSLAAYSLNGHTVYTNTQPAQVPSSLGGTVVAVLGLSNAATYAVGPKTSDVKTPLTGYTPQGFQKAYDAGSVPTGSTTNAAVIAEGDVSGVITDLRTAEAAYGLPQVPVNVVNAGLASSDTAGADEWDLDSQYVTGMAGDVASLTFYTATSMTDQDIALAFNQWESDDTAQVANASFGICETFAYLDGSMVLDDEVLNLAAQHGQTLFSSTGDTGSSCGFILPTNGVPLTGLPEVEYPAASPYAVGVGGTRLVTSSDDTYTTETAWEAGGGGISQHEASPAWQANTVLSNTGCSCKGLPDIAMDAALDTGALVYVGGEQEVIGGTSLASPLAAGSWARLESAHGNALGFAAPLLYGVYQRVNPSLTGIAAVPGFHDVIAGANGLYTAKPGWDYTTGLGSLDLAALSGQLG
jgi:pseudomonalisin